MTKTQFITALRTDSAVDVTEYADDALWRYVLNAIREIDSSIEIADNAEATGITDVDSLLHRPIVLLAQISICLNRAAKLSQKASISTLEGSFNYQSAISGNLSVVTALRQEYDTYVEANNISASVIEVSDFVKKRPLDTVVKDYPRVGVITAPSLVLDSFAGGEARVSWSPFTGTMFLSYTVLKNTTDVFMDVTNNSSSSFNISDDAEICREIHDVRSIGALVEEAAEGEYICVLLKDVAGRYAFSNSVLVTAGV